MMRRTLGTVLSAPVAEGPGLQGRCRMMRRTLGTVLSAPVAGRGLHVDVRDIVALEALVWCWDCAITGCGRRCMHSSVALQQTLAVMCFDFGALARPMGDSSLSLQASALRCDCKHHNHSCDNGARHWLARVAETTLSWD